MKKIALVLGMMFVVSAFASDSCYRTCDSNANQNGLMCQKIRQMCMRSGPDAIDMCIDDFQSCLQHGKSLYDACRDACDKEEQE